MRILLVEDDRDHILLTKNAFKNYNESYIVEAVNDGEQAFDRLFKEDFDLVLLDYALPKTNGLEILKKIVDLKKDLPVIMITGLGSEKVAAEALKFGVYEYVIKNENYFPLLPPLVEKAVEKRNLIQKEKELVAKLKESELALSNRNKELTIINEVIATINQSLDIDEILSQTTKKIVNFMKVDAGVVYLFDDIEKKLILSTYYGLSQNELDILMHSHSSINYNRLGHKDNDIDNIVSTYPVLSFLNFLYQDSLDEFTIKTSNYNSSNEVKKNDFCLFIPLKSKKKILGILCIMNREARGFEQKEIDLLYTICSQVGVVVENARLFEGTQRQLLELTAKEKELERSYQNLSQQMAELSAIYDVSKNLMSTLTIDKLLEQILKILQDTFNYNNCAIFLLDREKDELYIRASRGYPEDKVKNVRVQVGDGITGWVAKTGEPLYIPNITENHRYIPGLKGGKSELAVPMIIENKVIGVLDVESEKMNAFGERDIRIIFSFAAQAAIAIENARLFEELKQAYETQKKAQEELIKSEKLRALGEMAGGVAHDFNNLLAAILGRTQLLLKYTNDERSKKWLQIIEQTALDGAETVRRIQEFTRLQKDDTFIKTSINRIVGDAVRVTRTHWKDKPEMNGIKIDIAMDLGDIPPVAGNPAELREVLMNLIINAVDAMPNGGKITIKTYQQNGYVFISVSDTGIGMSEDVKKRVFDPFFTTKGVKGTGLGLSVTYGIVSRHQGEIFIESEPNKGANFIIKLPIGLSASEKVEEEVIPKVQRKANILVIDDQEIVRDMLVDMLTMLNHNCKSAKNGREGLDIFKKEDFDIVFTDLGMPEISGWEVAKEIKKIKPKTIVVLITGWKVAIDSNKMNEIGVDISVSKPFGIATIEKTVQKALEMQSMSS